MIISNAVVTTSIRYPSKELLSYSNLPGWTVYVAGDRKTPHSAYENLPNVVYLHPDQQRDLCPELSDIIGWNCIQRRYAAVIAAYKAGAEVFAFADDDNMPYQNWSMDTHLLVESVPPIEVDNYRDAHGVFDPFSVTSHASLWHRGYPLDLVSTRRPFYMGKIAVKPLVFERLVDGDPDIDAILRLPHRPIVQFNSPDLYTTTDMTVFNSQNTLVARKAIPYYLNLPGVGRFDDIFGSYLLQRLAPFKRPFIVFGKATAYQERVEQDLVKNLELELFGYRHAQTLISGSIENK